MRRWIVPAALTIYLVALSLAPAAAGGPPRLSDDRELKEIDLAGWNCLTRPEGSAKTPDGQERNRLKNRIATDLSTLKLQDLDPAKFLQGVAAFEAQTKGKRRKDLSPAERQQLDPLENEIVQVTGYLVLAYCGPPETTNCASVDFHDWHLEVSAKPSDHPPQPGDPTPIICEITPRTQNAIYADKVRIQELTAFFRRSDLTYEPSGHPARKIRLIGYRMWDDEHNGRADVGEAIRSVGANKYHNPWRSSAWEIHPVLKIVPLDGPSAAASHPSASPIATAPLASSPALSQTVAPAAVAQTPAPPPAAPVDKQFITVTQSVRIKIPYGETVVPRGAKLRVTSHTDQTVLVEYMGQTYALPITSTDYR
ncbi:MAG: hypothetical protein JWO45_158 [Spartobacteria bacterium]|nr:hypothetical protein [Spartobacteria bacterium]